MPTRSDFQEKMDVLDMIISILREHEENLSRLTDRFDAIGNDLAAFEEKISILDNSLERLDGLSVKNVIGARGLKGPLVTVECKNWLTFRSVSQGALLITFEVIDDLLSMSSVSDLFIFNYSENFPKLETVIGDGMEKWFKCHPMDSDMEIVSSEDGDSVYETILKSGMVKQWLSSELGVSEEKVVEGRIIR